MKCITTKFMFAIVSFLRTHLAINTKTRSFLRRMPAAYVDMNSAKVPKIRQAMLTGSSLFVNAE